MKQNICELDTMIFFREALEAHEFMLLPVMASAVVECRTADKELKTLNEDGEIGLARLFSIWANMMCAPGAATIVGCRPITMLSEILAQVHAYLTVHPLYDPEGLALYVELQMSPPRDNASGYSTGLNLCRDRRFRSEPC